MTAYELEPWHDLFVMTGGAAAALAGLLFVAVSLNLEQVLKYAALPTLAGQSVALLIVLLIVSVLALAPGQGRTAFGVELVVIGLALAVASTVASARVLKEIERRVWRVQRVVLGLVEAVPIVAGGVSMIAGAGGGLWWILAAVILLFVVSTSNAWTLLIEIRR